MRKIERDIRDVKERESRTISFWWRDERVATACLYGDGGKWQDVNANGRIPARFLINFFAIITTAR